MVNLCFTENCSKQVHGNYISDLYQPDGRVVPFKTWVARGVPRYNLMKWMGLVYKTRQMNREKSEPSAEATQLCFQSKGPIEHLSNKAVYNGLLAKRTQHCTHVYIPRIARHLENENIN